VKDDAEDDVKESALSWPEDAAEDFVGDVVRRTRRKTMRSIRGS